MAATATQRQTRRVICRQHGIEYGQTQDPGVPGQRESVWLPPDCPSCEVELRQKLAADAEEIRIERELVDEADWRANNDAGRDERIDLLVETEMYAQATQFVREFYATRRPEFETFYASEDWQRIFKEVKEERRTKILEELRKGG